MNDSEKNIMLIEDNHSHAQLIMRSIKKHISCDNVTRASNGEEALNYLFRKAEYADDANWFLPNLILLDLRLPRVSGLEVLEKIKSDDTLKVIPTIILTSSQADGDIQKAYELHANSYLVKPLDFQMLSELLKDLGHYWTTLNVQKRNHEMKL